MLLHRIASVYNSPGVYIYKGHCVIGETGGVGIVEVTVTVVGVVIVPGVPRVVVVGATVVVNIPQVAN